MDNQPGEKKKRKIAQHPDMDNRPEEKYSVTSPTEPAPDYLGEEDRPQDTLDEEEKRSLRRVRKAINRNEQWLDRYINAPLSDKPMVVSAIRVLRESLDEAHAADKDEVHGRMVTVALAHTAVIAILETYAIVILDDEEEEDEGEEDEGDEGDAPC